MTRLLARSYAVLLSLPAFSLFLCAARAVDLPTQKDSRLISVFHADRIWNAVATTPDGRVFVGFPSFDRPGVQVEELGPDGNGHPYPTAGWNARKSGGGLKSAFVHANALRIGPDGALYIVDAGSPGPGQPIVPGGARLFRIDLSTNRVTRTYSLAPGIRDKSYINDVRFNGSHAYFSDSGAPGLLVLELKTGAVRRVLNDDPSTTDLRPMRADGRILADRQGHELRVQADQIEVSPNGDYLYYQPASGPMARIETRWLDDPFVSATKLARHVENWLDTPTCGGTAIDADGNIYFTDPDHRSILKISPNKAIRTLISDPRLIWGDALWIDREGFLWIPATQINLAPAFNNGRQGIHYPVWIYKMQVDARPPIRDHP